MLDQRPFTRLRPLSLMLAALLILSVGIAAAPLARADATTDAYLEPRMTEKQYEQYLDMLKLSAEQRLLAEMNYDSYARSLEDIRNRAEEAADGAGRRRIADALAGKVQVNADELRGLRAQVIGTYAQFWPELDQALDKLLGRTAAVLTDSQRERVPAALRWVHREVHLRPHQPEQPTQDYAGDGLDMLALIDAARGEDGELATIAAEKLDPVITNYQAQIEPFLIETTASYRQDRLAEAMARIRREPSKLEAAQQRLLERWQRLYTLNRRTAQQIADLAAQVGGEGAKTRWLDRFNEATFTWLYRDRKPDRQLDWLMRNSLTDETRQRIQQIHAKFDARRDALAAKAVDIMVRARTELGIPLHAMMDPNEIDDSRARSMYEELLRNSGELSALDAETSRQYEAALDTRMRNLLRQTVR